MQSAAEKDSFTWSRSLKILEHALKGIVGLHSWKPQIVHRDLKSMNLLVDDNWNVKVRTLAKCHTRTHTYTYAHTHTHTLTNTHAMYW